MDATAFEDAPRDYRLRRSYHFGYGFIAGSECPTMVKIVEPNGPSFGRLRPGDVIMAVNGINVERAPREKIIQMIHMSQDEIDLRVRQPSYEEILRANLANPSFYKTDTNGQVASAQHPNSQQHLQSPSHLTKNFPSTAPAFMNNLVTPISQQQLQQPKQQSPKQQFQVPIDKQNQKMVLKQRTDDNETLPIACQLRNNLVINGTSTLGRKSHSSNIKYGRHSPLLQRCKSSMDNKSGKKSGDPDNDQPMLKRSNTMRPMKPPPAKVLEIFEVVIRIFFEDGHTKVLNYNRDTTVATILETLSTRLLGNSTHLDQVRQYFGLVLTVNSEENHKDQLLMNKRKLLHILDENDSIMKIRQLPYASKLRLLYRVIYPPSDINKLYTQEKIAFDYLYKQSCNDLKLERFSPDIETEAAIKLAALHIVEYVYSNHPKDHGNSKEAKLYMKLVKKTPGLNHFVPASMIDKPMDKKGKKTNYKRLKTKLLEQLKKNFEEFEFEPPKVRSTTNLNHYTSTSFHELALLPGLQSSPSDYIKLLFLNYLSQLPCYGNSKRPVRESASPIERNSVGDCSSSMESVPRTSDSSPLLKQDRNTRTDASNTNAISRLAQMNSIRSLNSSVLPASSLAADHDQIDMAQTPSIESISSITFNMHGSPSPQRTPSHASQRSESYLFPDYKRNIVEPSPMPRQQMSHLKSQDYNSIEKIYSQRYERPLEDLLKNAILLPPPPTPTNLFNNVTNHRVLFGSVTPILTDRDLDRLRVPPPPRISY